jgi:acyl-CoA thioesterase-2
MVSLLALEEIGSGIFRGVSQDVSTIRVFGGQVAAQSLVAAGRTVGSGRPVHSLHAYFLLPGDPALPIVYEVERTRDGRSFSTRRVVATQRGKVIFSLSASFHRPEEGPAHQAPWALSAARPPDPGDAGEEPARTSGGNHSFPIEVRQVRAPLASPADPRQQSWIRADGALPDDPLIHVCVLAYASDLGLLAAALPPHGLSPFSGEVTMASLDHAMWFHRPFRADDWLYYANESPVASGARALARGEVYDRAGRLVASVVQEGLLRVVGPG